MTDPSRLPWPTYRGLSDATVDPIVRPTRVPSLQLDLVIGMSPMPIERPIKA